MEEARADRVELVVLEHGVVRGLLAVEDDVEDRVQAVVAGQDAAQLALLHDERVRLLAAAVEDAGDHPGRAQTARLRATRGLARLHAQLYAFAGHRRASVAKASRKALCGLGLEAALELRDVDAQLALSLLEALLANGEEILPRSTASSRSSRSTSTTGRATPSREAFLLGLKRTSTCMAKFAPAKLARLR